MVPWICILSVGPIFINQCKAKKKDKREKEINDHLCLQELCTDNLLSPSLLNFCEAPCMFLGNCQKKKKKKKKIKHVTTATQVSSYSIAHAFSLDINSLDHPCRLIWFVFLHFLVASGPTRCWFITRASEHYNNMTSIHPSIHKNLPNTYFHRPRFRTALKQCILIVSWRKNNNNNNNRDRKKENTNRMVFWIERTNIMPLQCLFLLHHPKTGVQQFWEN